MQHRTAATSVHIRIQSNDLRRGEGRKIAAPLAGQGRGKRVHGIWLGAPVSLLSCSSTRAIWKTRARHARNTLPFSSDFDRDTFQSHWFGPHSSFVATTEAGIAGMYKFGANYLGLGSHRVDSRTARTPQAVPSMATHSGGAQDPTWD